MNRTIITAVFILIGLVGILLWIYSSDRPINNPSSNTTAYSTLDHLPKQVATIRNTNLNIYITRSPQETTQGLSNTHKLASNTGLLFDMRPKKPYSEQHSFWMKDMNYPIDILWFDKDLILIHYEDEISPNTYPLSFTNPENTKANYVLEINGGDIKRLNIKIGDKLKLNKPI